MFTEISKLILDESVDKTKQSLCQVRYYLSYCGVLYFDCLQLSLVLIRKYFFTCIKVDIIDKTVIFIYNLKVHFMCFQDILEL